MLNAEQIAEVCHEANKAYCAQIGDFTHVPWRFVGEAIQHTSVSGVLAVMANVHITAEEVHFNWCNLKLADGWTYGKVKYVATKVHPNIVPFKELPAAEQMKTRLWLSVVLTLIGRN